MKPFAKFNGFPHQDIEVPDGGFTASFRTSEGKRVTVCFVPYNKDGPPQCVDVAYHDSGRTVMNADKVLPVMHSVGFTVGTNVYDTRGKNMKPLTLLTVLLDDASYKK